MLYPAELRALSSPTIRMVGAEGFEPPTLCSQSRCATRLRHAPPCFALPVAATPAASGPGSARERE